MPKQYSALISAILLVSANNVPAAPCPNNACAAAGNMAATATSLNASERDGLLLMREEEKLAHDVYQALSTHWRLPTFANIRSSETRHNTAMQTLLNRYGLADPSAGRSAGDFANPQLQALYT